MMARDPQHQTMPPDGQLPSEQPKWRQDFPIDWPQDEYVSRRELVRFMVLTSLAFVTGQFWLLGKEFLAGEPRVFPMLPIAGVDDLPIGGSLVFRYPEKDATSRLLIRTGENTFVAYDQQCTHLLCPVIPRVEESQLHCPCHNGIFDLATGRPMAGPPRRPLVRVTLEVREGTVYATGVEVRAV